MKIDTNEIPAMIHPLGQAWRQPSTDDILIDEEVAVMTEETMNELHKYCTTIPSGVYVGKMWRTETHLKWYDVNEDPDLMSIITREIILL